MIRYSTKANPLINGTLLLLSFCFLIVLKIQAQPAGKYPYSTNSSNLTVWNGSTYVPFFIKGVNLGVAVPGTFPGEMAASRSDYARWLQQIKDAGFNCIRLYTLHYPRFYEVLDSFNSSNSQNPLLFFQGVWLEEELSGYNNDLYYLSKAFKQEIEENIDCVHGNGNIPERKGKAYGSYTHNVSKWCLGYIIGREVYPVEIHTTDKNNPSVKSYNGNHFSISSASASEAWFTSMLDHTVHYEHTTYKTQRPVSCSNWPTLDPVSHPEEPNRDEDTASIDLSKITVIKAPAGIFISYHAYPYYPDFISNQSTYQSYSDNYGPDSYLGYLTELKSHYTKFPLIIAEYGVPSSWAIAHYSTSGMNHGGIDEHNQGLMNIRLLDNISSTGCGGGMQFSWIDEWFKNTWITAPTDYLPESRILWHNAAAAEQNFGLVSFEKTIDKDTLHKFDAASDIKYVNSEVNYSYFELEIGLKNPLDIPDELWITLDTYDKNLGESKLPTGETIPGRAEFALQLTNYSAKLMVTEAYDIFGIWHNISGPKQLYHSIATDGAPWEIVRLKNNSGTSDVQYIGNLQVDFDFQPPSSKDGVVISDDKILVRIPWFYINMVAPDQMRVFNDNRNTPQKEDTVSDGFAISVLYKNKWYSHPNRLKWNTWTSIPAGSVDERLKTSYYYVQDQLTNFNTPAFAVCDSYDFSGRNFPVVMDADSGLLKNDFDIDGNVMTSLITDNPVNGHLYLNNNGSFSYEPNAGFSGYDSLNYCVYDGYSLSKPNKVVIFINQNTSVADHHPAASDSRMKLYPNPSYDVLHIESDQLIRYFQVFDMAGKLIESHAMNDFSFRLNLTDYLPGKYILVAGINGKLVAENFIIESK